LSTEKNQFDISAFNETYYLHETSEGAGGRLPSSEYRCFELEAIRERIQNTVHEVQYELQAQEDARHGADEGIGHALKNIVDLTNWTEALSLLRSLIRNYDQLVARKGLEELFTRLNVASRSLGLFSLVAGLGHFARLAGAIGRGDYAKFVAWHDSEEFRRWSSGTDEDSRYVCDAFANTVYRIVGSLCASMSVGKERPYLFEVGCEYERSLADVTILTPIYENSRGQFDKHDLHVPPFKKGCDAAYSFIFALTEPLVNALRALDALGTNPDLSVSERTLKVRISPSLPEEVIFSVINTSSVRIPKTLSGFETTRRMLRRVGIAEINNPRVQEMRAGVYEVICEVRFKPYYLANKIAEEYWDQKCRAI
jgi:hypothetical protein